MNVIFRNYNHTEDYKLVSDFLVAHHQSGNKDGNWLEPTWEYMHGHPYLDSSSLEKIGIWEDVEKIIGVAHYESRLGEAFFQFHPEYRHLRNEMLEYAESDLTGISKRDGRKYLRAHVNDNDAEFLSLVREHGYERDPDGDRPMTKFDIGRSPSGSLS